MKKQGHKLGFMLFDWRGVGTEAGHCTISEVRNFYCGNFATFMASNFIYAQAILVESEGHKRQGD